MAGSLKEYQRKRDFTVTSEPKPRKGRAKGSSFVIQMHAARRLHYDFRLELDGVLKSWAITRGPSLIAGEKRLAVHVEDHPLAYGTFEGTIPEGQYGAGSVLLWDRGTWEPEGDIHKAYKKGHLDFTLNGEKLRGRWHLVRMHGKPGEKHENWLLIKSEDDAARHRGDPDILVEADRSVATGRSIKDIGTDKKSRTWQSTKVTAEPAEPAKTASTSKLSPRRRIAEALRAPAKSAAVKAPTRTPTPKTARKKANSNPPAKSRTKVPAGLSKAAPLTHLEPQLATLSQKAPQGDAWLHEVKFDGYRMQAIKTKGETRLWTRRGHDWTERFQPIADAVSELPGDDLHFDGEIVIEDASGISDFARLQSALKQGDDSSFVYYAFDLLAMEGRDIRPLPLHERKDLLRKLMPVDDAVLKYSDHFTTPGARMLDQVCRFGGEGIVSKKRDAPYRSGRAGDWLKSKCSNRQEFVIVGYVPSTTSRKAIGSLVLGYYQGTALIYAGRVGTGYTSSMAGELFTQLDAVKMAQSPIAKALPVMARRGVVWTKPQFVAEVEFRGWTGDGLLRQAAFKGLREDKDPHDIVREDAPVAKPARTPSTSLKLTHPDRLLWPRAGITKEGLADYYTAAWPLMEAHVIGRPLALVRCPTGIEKACFFQKHAWQGMSKSIRLITDPKDEEQLIYIEDLDGLLALVQSSALEIHPWGARTKTLDRPDRLIFDLDPGDGIDWSDLVSAAQDVRSRLSNLKLESFVKTSGGKGLHVVVPISPNSDWATAKSFCQSIATSMAKDSPRRYTDTMAKTARKSRIYVDYLRNGRGATAVCAYSARARAEAGVSTPLTWEELDHCLGGAQFTLSNINKRLAHIKQDPWRDFANVKQKLPAATTRKR